MRASRRLLLVATTGLAGLLATAPAHGAPKVDVVVLQNGSRVVGEVRSMSRGKLELKTDDMGTLQIEWGNVAQVTAPELFEVEDMRGRLYFGSLANSPDAQGGLEVQTASGPERLALAEVARIQLVKARFWDRFRGSIDVGASYASATELLDLELDGSLRFRRPRFEAAVSASAVITQQPEVEDTRRSSLTAGYTRLFANRQRLYAQGSLEQNRELGYDLRSAFVVGWAYLLVRDTRNELIGGTGLALNRETPVEGESTTNVEAVVGFNYANFAYDFPNTDVQIASFGYLGLSQWGRFRLEASASLRREVFADFYVGVKAYESYDSAPATAGASRNDWGLSLTLGYTF